MLSRFGYIHALVGIFIGIAILVFGGQDAINEIQLRRKGVTIEADAHDWRTLTENHVQTSYEAQYTFKLPGDDKAYSRGDSTGRTDLWSTLPKEVWLESKRTGKLSVVYVPSNPIINRPTQPGGFISGDLIAALVCGILALLLSSVLLFYLAFTGQRCVEL